MKEFKQKWQNFNTQRAAHEGGFGAKEIFASSVFNYTTRIEPNMELGYSEEVLLDVNAPEARFGSYILVTPPSDLKGLYLMAYVSEEGVVVIHVANWRAIAKPIPRSTAEDRNIYEPESHVPEGPKITVPYGIWKVKVINDNL